MNNNPNRYTPRCRATNKKNYHHHKGDGSFNYGRLGRRIRKMLAKEEK